MVRRELPKEKRAAPDTIHGACLGWAPVNSSRRLRLGGAMAEVVAPQLGPVGEVLHHRGLDDLV